MDAVLLYVNVAFLVLFVVYIAQLSFILKRLRESATVSSRKGTNDLWPYMAMSLVIPILIGFLPGLLGQAFEHLMSSLTPAKTTFTPCSTPSSILYIGVEFLIAYLVTIVTLELALQAAAFQTGSHNPWRALLLANLGFDVISIVVFHIFKIILENIPPGAAGTTTSPVVSYFFLACAVPTALTGVIVIGGSYSALTGVAK